MNGNSIRPLGRALAVAALALTLLGGNAWAAKPDWVEDGKGKKSKTSSEARDGGRERAERGDRDGERQRSGGQYFNDERRRELSVYFGEQRKAGFCPPGLAKKNNGCLPPGQAKKQWSVGQPLPAGVIYHKLPHDVEIRLGVPPKGHEFVRVATDILLIAVGTGMVIDAIEDLGKL